MPYLVVTIDTEEDNWGEYQRPSYSVENLSRVPRLQELFMRRGVRPTYLITYPVATDPESVKVLGRYQDDGGCEIGTHIHPWNTPPIDEERNALNSYISNLPGDLQYRKIKTLHETIAKNFGRIPRSYRSGRWGFNHEVAKNLIRLDYAVDSSVYPLSDWRDSGGPDYKAATLEPFRFQQADRLANTDRFLLEIPATIDFLQRRRSSAARAYWTIKNGLPGADKLLAALGRLRLINHICLSPELSLAPQMAALARKLLDRGTPVLNMFFHSASLLPGCSPFVRTEGDARNFVHRIDEFLAFTQSMGLTSVTLSELSAENVGAAAVIPIPSQETDHQ